MFYFSIKKALSKTESFRTTTLCPPCLCVKSSFILTFITIHLLFVSCATTVTFEVEHPPLVDFRNAKTITVIPFEWNTGIRYSGLASDATNALVFGIRNNIRNGTLNYIDPAPLRYVSDLDLYKYVDVYVIGRITNVSVYDNARIREDRNNINSYNHDNSREGRRNNDRDRGRDNNRDRDRNRGRDTDRDRTRITSITRTVTVDIEYSYIRASNNKVVGFFKKSATSYDTADQTITSYIPVNWTDSIAANAIGKFSHTMSRELGSWVTTEERTLRGSFDDPTLTEANKMIQRQYYGRAYELYSETYNRSDNINAGFNLAIMLQFDGKYSEALELLEEIQGRILASGKRVPNYISREIGKLSKFIEGFIVLEGYEK